VVRVRRGRVGVVDGDDAAGLIVKDFVPNPSWSPVEAKRNSDHIAIGSDGDRIRDIKLGPCPWPLRCSVHRSCWSPAFIDVKGCPPAASCIQSETQQAAQRRSHRRWFTEHLFSTMLHGPIDSDWYFVIEFADSWPTVYRGQRLREFAYTWKM